MAAMKAISFLVACLMVTALCPSGCAGSSSSSYSSSSVSSSSAPTSSSSSSSSEAVVSSSSSSVAAAISSSSSSSSIAAAVSSSSSSSIAASSSSSSVAASSSSSSSVDAAVSSSSSAGAAAGTTTPTPTPIPDTIPVVLIPIPPSDPEFNLPASIAGNQTLTINLGTVPNPTTTNVKLLLEIPNATGDDEKEIALFGPSLFPSAPVTVTMPVLLTVQTGVFLRIVTFAPDGAALFDNCVTCVSSTFTLALGGRAADPAAVQEAQQPIAPREENSTPPGEAIFIIRTRAAANKPLDTQEVTNLFTSVDTTNMTPAEALNLLTSAATILSDTTNSGSGPSPAVAAKIEAMMEKVLGKGNTVATVFEREQSDSLMDTLAKFLKHYGLNANAKKFGTQLTAAEEAANVIPKLLESLRQVAAQTIAKGGTIDRSNVCSHVVTNANGGTFCNGASQFPHVIELIGNNLPSDSSRRMTAISMDLAGMDRSDQTLTNTLDLRTGVSPHFSTIINPLVSDPAAHQLRSTFDQAKNNNAAAADNTFNCYQRVATQNADPSGNYVQIAAANQDRPSATTIRCIGANSNLPRWVTLAKPVANAGNNGGNNGANNGNTGPTGSSTISPPVTPTAPPTARTVAADSDDGSSASGIIGGVFGGVGFLLIIFALIALVLLKAKKTSSDSQALTSEEVYWQDNGAYKVPAPTPV